MARPKSTTHFLAVRAKKTPAPRKRSTLEERVQALEQQQDRMRSDMDGLLEDVHSLKTTVKRVDERSQRGEKLMMHMQVEQRRQANLLERIGVALSVPGVTVTTPLPEQIEAAAAEKLADAPDTDDLPPL